MTGLSGKLLFIGTGYVARRAAPVFRASGFDMMGTFRDREDIPELEALNIKPVHFDGHKSPAFEKALSEATHIIVSVPPKGGDPVLNAYPGDWQKRAPHVRWLAYLSATSVYGDRDGGWAFEHEWPTPLLQRGEDRAEAEIGWIETLLPVHIFRLAGIYGPGRAPFERIRKGNARRIIKPGHTTNRIHVDDIIAALILSMEQPNPQSLYNLADGHPAPPEEVLEYAAELIGEPAPREVPLVSDDISDMARTFYAETKRVSSIKAQVELGWEPQYPDYKAGLQAVLSEES